jgi:S1-C subfamily serine protease
MHFTVRSLFVTDDGYIATNAHVVDEATRIDVKTTKGTLQAKVVHVDKDNDLALLKVSGEFQSLPVVSSRRLSEGSKVFTFGFPNPDIQGVEPVYTSGDISKLSGIADNPRTLQISVPIQPGNSGGPLVDEFGNVVGVVVARLNALKLLEKTGSLPQNVNYAVKSTRLLTLLEEHIPDAAKRLRKGYSRKARDPALIRSRVNQATVLILVETKPPASP